MTDRFSFALNATDSAARTGVISTPRGEIRTPAISMAERKSTTLPRGPWSCA